MKYAVRQIKTEKIEMWKKRRCLLRIEAECVKVEKESVNVCGNVNYCIIEIIYIM